MPGNTDPRPVKILLVEDSPDDADLMVAALQEGSLNFHITVLEDGETAMDYLLGNGAHAAAPRPDLILLDLHLPRKNGFEVLAEIKGDAVLHRIPVIILTSSDDEKAILAAYDRHANCYVCKPADQEEFALAVRRIEHFWVHVARLLRSPENHTEGRCHESAE
jgi:DNA-binding response OmpR family regulator